MLLDQLSDGAKRLVFVLCLPLLDGVFATLMVSGALQTFTDVVAVSLTVFSGAGAFAVLYSSAETVEEAKSMVLQAAPVLFTGALAVSLVAPVFEQLFYVERMRYAAGIALLVIAAEMLDLEVAEKLSVPAVLLTGAALSLKNPGSIALSLEYIGPALATSFVALGTLYAASHVRADRLDISWIRRGGGAVLALISLSLFGIGIPSGLGLAVLTASFIAAVR
ncbi:MAG: DUF5794 domain-containing protein [Candidatus Nanohaloarchaea archaeon]